MNAKREALISILLAFFLLLSMLLQLDAWLMAGVAIAVLVILAIFQFTRPTVVRP